MKYIQHNILLFCLLLLCVEAVRAQNYTVVTDPRFPRKALLRNDCLISNSAEVVGVGTGSGDKENLLDEDLTNCTHLVTVANVGALLDPVLQIKDLKHTYPKGTNAGFCIEAGSGSVVLSLELIKSTYVAFYKDGKMVESPVVVKEGQSAGLLNLGLIQIPGKSAVLHLTAEAPGEFDEISLMFGGIDIQVANVVKVRYAFVGDEIEHPLINSADLKIKAKGMNIRDEENMINDNLEDYAYQAKNLIVSYASINLSRQDNKFFKKGSEVGFFMHELDVADIGLAGVTKIRVRNSRMDMSEEFLIDAGALGLNLIGGQKKKISVIAPFDFDEVELKIVEVDLLSIVTRHFYYGFVTEPTKVSHVPDLFVSMDAYIGKDVTSYEVYANKPCYWKLIKAPESEHNLVLTPPEVEASTNCTLSGMTPYTEGEYVIEAVSADGCGCRDTIVLIRGNVPGLPEDCKKPLSGDNIVVSDTIHDSSGSLISISKLKNPEYLVDDKSDTYAEYIGGLSLANNLMIAGVKTKDHSSFTDGKEKKKVGFLVETSSEVLDAKVLEFFQIRVYKDGKETYRKVIANSDIAQVGAIGASKTSKIMFGIHVPEGILFDEITLWKSGVLDLAISTLRIYTAHVSDSKLQCYEDPLACGSIPVSTDGTGAHLKHNSLNITGVATVGAAMLNMENMLDNDLENSHATIVRPVGLISNWSVAVKLGRIMDKSHQACIVMSEKTYTAALGLGASLKVELLLTGVKDPVTTKTNWGVLGVDAIGFGDKIYFFINPTSRYDEIRISYQDILGVDLGEFDIYGFAVRHDVNNNGVADCIEEPMLLNAFTAQDICVDDSIYVSGYGKAEAKYKVGSTALGIAEKEYSIDKEGNFLWNLGKAEKPFYSATIDITPVDVNDTPAPLLHVNIHPLQSTWTPKVAEGTGVIATPTRWNMWGNWSEGTPWYCTDVIIPEGKAYYPELLSDEVNACRYIHFEQGGEVVKTHLLDYQKAWVEARIEPNRYYMLTIPLKRIYSGDWFIAEGQPKVEYFTVMNQKNYPENRVTPTIYQRVWDAATVDKMIDANNRPYPKPADRVDLAKTGWVKPFNWLATPYDKNDVEGTLYDFNALSVWVHSSKPSDPNGGDLNQEYTFRFPKEHGIYHYYDEDGKLLSVSEQIADRKQSGRFIYEQEDSTVTFPLVLTYKNRSSAANTTFLVGNPFMAHLKVEELLKENQHITSVKVYDGANGTANSQIAQLDGAGILTATPTDVTAYASIAPLQSFFVTCQGDIVESCPVTFTEKMLESQPQGALLRSSAPAPDSHSIRMMANARGKQAAALVHFSTCAHDTYRAEEDATLLMENAMKPTVALFTVADEQALDIQQRAQGGEIPLGIYLAEPTDVELQLTLPKGYEGWLLKDHLKGVTYSLSAGSENSISLGRQTSSVGRFSLMGKAQVTHNETIRATQPKLCCYREEGTQQLVVTSDEGMMVRCEIYSVEGRLVGVSKWETDIYRLPVAEGVHIVKVFFKEGISSSVKVF